MMGRHVQHSPHFWAGFLKASLEAADEALASGCAVEDVREGIQYSLMSYHFSPYAAEMRRNSEALEGAVVTDG